jgi:hypothetical protein
MMETKLAITSQTSTQKSKTLDGI